MSDSEDSDVSDSPAGESPRLDEAKTHAKQLQGLKDSQAEFYSYLQEFDKDLLDFDEDDSDEEAGADLDSDGEDRRAEKAQKPAAKVITTEMVDSWCGAVRENRSLGAIRSLLRAFRAACHCGDDGENDSTKLNIVSSSVFNKVMVFVLNDMDGILRGLLRAPSHGGKKETVMELMTTKAGKKYGSLMKLYLGNGLHILNQMTDEQMISFTLKRIKASAVFLAAFPTLLRKYIKVALHAWGTGRGSLPVVAFLFLRDLCVKVGGDCIDSCLRGVYKAFAMNCKLAKSVSRSKLGHINFLGNCVTELYGVDLSSAYQQAFLFIRQLAVILHGALTERGTKVVKDKKKGKQQKQSNKSEKSYQKVYDWQYISCLELWTAVVCTYKSESDFRPLAYPLTQLIHGVACLVPTARYFPLRLRCVRMLNRIAGATGTFIPVSSLLLDMLEMKELNSPPTGGIGKAVDLIGIKQVDKTTLKTRAFQQACVYSIVEELAEHLSQWSYSVTFFELSFIPLVRLRNFCKSTKVDRFRREIRELIRQVEANSEFTNSRRTSIKFTPNEQAPESFMKVEKETGSSPLSQFVADLRLRAKERNDSMTESSVVVGEKGSKFHREDDDDDDDEEEEDDEDDGGGADVFNSSWLPAKKSKDKDEPKTPKKRRHEEEHDGGGLEDIVEDLVLSSDDEVDEDEDDEGDDELLTNRVSSENGKEGSKYRSSKHRNKKQKPMPSANTEEKVQKLAASASPPKKARRQRWKKKVRKGSSG